MSLLNIAVRYTCVQDIKFKISSGPEPPLDPGDVFQVRLIDHSTFIR
jgi:hypothetical protein